MELESVKILRYLYPFWKYKKPFSFFLQCATAVHGFFGEKNYYLGQTLQPKMGCIDDKLILFLLQAVERQGCTACVKFTEISVPN